MIYYEQLDSKKLNAVKVDIYCLDTAYDEMYKWCIEHDTNNRFSSIIDCTTEDYLNFDYNNGGSGAFYFDDANDALLFRIRWGNEVR